MNAAIRVLAPLVLALLGLPARAAEPSPAWDGLVEVKAKRMDTVQLLPGADFRPYTKVLIDPTEVAFRKNWMSNINRDRPGMANDVTQADAERIAAAARANFADVFAEPFRKAGYEVVTAPGPGVLRLSPAVIDLYINAPDTGSGALTRSYTMEAGQATLALEGRDAVTGALLGRVLDRRETRSRAGMQVTSSVSNTSDFRALFERWARTCVEGLAELKAQSPVPEDLQPKQKLP